MRSGKLRHKICIEEKVTLRNAMGEEEITWVPFCYAWASIEPLSGREWFSAQQTQASTSHRIVMRYQPGIKPYHQITWDGRTFNIDTILNPEERNRELVMLVTEAV